LNFADIDKIKKRDPDRKVVGLILIDAAKKLKLAGADCLVLCANTLHIFTKQIEQAVSLPIVHIADAVENFALKSKIKKAGLLGTRLTMERSFIRIGYFIME
jgi:aspartate racemase